MRYNVRDIPTSYADANKMLGKRHQRNISKNGLLLRDELHGSIKLRLFRNTIVIYFPNEDMYITSAGYNTRTTAYWINVALGNKGRVVKSGYSNGKYASLEYWHNYRTEMIPTMINSDGHVIKMGTFPSNKK